jgi:hypothetical protein
MSRDAELLAESLQRIVRVLHDTLEYIRVRDRETEERWLKWREEDMAHQEAKDKIDLAYRQVQIGILKEGFEGKK